MFARIMEVDGEKCELKVYGVSINYDVSLHHNMFAWKQNHSVKISRTR